MAQNISLSMSQTQRMDASQMQVLEIVTIPLEELAEKIKNEDKMAAIQTYVALPGLIGAVKLMIDMSAFLISFLSIRVL